MSNRKWEPYEKAFKIITGVGMLVVLIVAMLFLANYHRALEEEAALREVEKQQKIDAFYDEGSRFCIKYSEKFWGKTMTIYSEACNKEEIK